MVLSDTDVKNLINKPKNSASIKRAKKLQDRSRVHFIGEGHADLLVELIGYEKAEQFKLRRGLCDPVTMEQTEYIFGELTRWTNNPDIVSEQNFKNNESDKKEFISITNKIWEGQDLQTFATKVISKGLFTNFNDFILIEKPSTIPDDNENIIISGKKKPIADKVNYYLMLVSINDVIDYDKTGNKVEYLIYRYSDKRDKGKTYKRYRVIDDKSDRVYIHYGTEVKQDESEFVLTYNSIPVRQLSSLFEIIENPNVCKCPIHHVIPLMDNYVKFDSINKISEIATAYPQEWAIGAPCDKCGGTGQIQSLDEGKETEKCPHCTNGYVKPMGNGEPLIIPRLVGEGYEPYNSTPAGTIARDTAILTYQKERLAERKAEIIMSALGSINSTQTNSDKTRDEIQSLISPLEDRNGTIAELVEQVQEWIGEWIGQNISIDFVEYKIRYSRNLNVLNKSVVLAQIKEAKTNGAPSSLIKQLNKSLIYSGYSNNKQLLKRHLTLLELEPFVGYSMDEIKDLDFVSRIDKIIKQYFNTIIGKIEQKSGDIVNYYEKNGRENVLNEIKTIATELIQN